MFGASATWLVQCEREGALPGYSGQMCALTNVDTVDGIASQFCTTGNGRLLLTSTQLILSSLLCYV